MAAVVVYAEFGFAFEVAGYAFEGLHVAFGYVFLVVLQLRSG